MRQDCALAGLTSRKQACAYAPVCTAGGWLEPHTRHLIIRLPDSVANSEMRSEPQLAQTSAGSGDDWTSQRASADLVATRDQQS